MDAAQAVAVTPRFATPPPGRPVDRLNAPGAVPPIVWARPGERLIIPVSPSDAEIASGRFDVHLDRGDALDATLFRLESSPAPAPSSPWLADWSGDFARSAWRSSAVQPTQRAAKPSPQPVRADDAAWFVSVNVPASAAGQGLWLGGRRAPVGWLMAPPFEPPPAAPSPSIPVDHYRPLLADLEPALRSPVWRWRARLALRQAGFTTADQLGVFDDPLVEALASQIEQEWTAGLRFLGASDPDLTRRVRDRLAGLVQIAPGSAETNTGRTTVVWNPDTTALEPLKRALLSGAVGSRDRIEAARQWLDGGSGAPNALAWIIDDAGSFDAAARRVCATVGVIAMPGDPRNQGAAPLAALAAAEGSDQSPVITTLSPGAMATLLLPGDPVTRRDRKQGLRAQVRVGADAFDRVFGAITLPVTPPGLQLGPLAPDWTLATWWPVASSPDINRLAPFPSSAEPAALCSAMLQKRTTRTAGPGIAAADEWVLFVECREPPEASGDSPTSASADPAASQRFRVFLGALNAPLAVITVDDQGRVEAVGPRAADTSTLAPQVRVERWGDNAAPDSTSSGSAPGRVRLGSGSSSQSPPNDAAPSVAASSATLISPAARGWCAWITLPPGCIEADPANPRSEGILRIGLEYTDARARRSAFPRPMTPWQNEPGRLRLDLGAWN